MSENRINTNEFFIENAGLVICNPFLPRLFSRLELTGESGFKDRESTEHAVLLLHYMLYGSNSLPEHLLVLNKLLCGLEPEIPVDRNIDVSEQEKEVINQMLEAMLQSWHSLGNISVKGFIDSFLIRLGKMEQHDGTWSLVVEQKGYDMLLDSIPWSYSPIRYSWMKKTIYVKWR